MNKKLALKLSRSAMYLCPLCEHLANTKGAIYLHLIDTHNDDGMEY